jgi:serine protease
MEIIMNTRVVTFCFAVCFPLHTFSEVIQQGNPVNNLSATTGDSIDYEIPIPSNASNLNIEIYNGSGDADLYVKAGSLPSESDNDCGPYLYGNDEQCVFDTPQATTYYIRIKAYQAFFELSLRATYETNGDSSSTHVIQNGIPLTGLTSSTGNEAYYKIHVPSEATQLSVNISGGTGDADLYVSAEQPPSSTSFDCRPYLNGNSETCNFNPPVTGDYFILLRAYSSYSGVTLTANYAISGGNDNSNYVWDGLENYYADAIGQTGSLLVSALADAAALNHNPLTYAQVWEALKYTDEDPANTNNVILIYSGRSQSKSYNSSGNNDPDAWNREHTWPKSHGFPSSSDWAYTDIHHLRPCDASVNSSRGNKDYDNGGDVISEAPENSTDTDSFEPRDEVKGDIARMMFYMDIRYNGNDYTGTDDLTLVNYTGTSGSFLGDMCTLYLWHGQDPVSSEEISRHERIVERQGNRNPFIDNPAWVNEIWGSQCE